MKVSHHTFMKSPRFGGEEKGLEKSSHLIETLILKYKKFKIEITNIMLIPRNMYKNVKFNFKISSLEW